MRFFIALALALLAAPAFAEYWINTDSLYIGQHELGEEPAGATEVPSAPTVPGEFYWTGSAWTTPPAAPPPPEPKHYIDAGGSYIGAFSGATPPAGSTEVPTPPDHAGYQTWNGSAWVDIADRPGREADDHLASTIDVDRTLRLIFELNFDQENRIRVLEGLGTITKAQYRNALKAKLDALP
jgi:hypothetical protein